MWDGDGTAGLKYSQCEGFPFAGPWILSGMQEGSVPPPIGSPSAGCHRGAMGNVDGWGEMFHSQHPTPSQWSPMVPPAPSPGSWGAAPPRPSILTRGLCGFQLRDGAGGSLDGGRPHYSHPPPTEQRHIPPGGAHSSCVSSSEHRSAPRSALVSGSSGSQPPSSNGRCRTLALYL